MLYYYGIIGAVRLEESNFGTHVMAAGYAVEHLVGLGHEPFGLGCAAAYAPQVAEMYPVDIFAYVAYVDVVCTQTLVCGCRKFFLRPVYCVPQLQGLSLGERDVARGYLRREDLVMRDGVAAVGGDGCSHDGELRCRNTYGALARIDVERQVGVVIYACVVLQQPRYRAVVEVGGALRTVEFVYNLDGRAA